MSNIQFVIAGISGDVSKRKVLPAIRNFVALHPDLKINLVGLSRFNVDIKEIQSIVDTFDNLYISLIQYNYDDPSIVSSILGRSEYTIFYLALPPVAFVNLLNLFCFLDKSKFDLVVEKPFASNLDAFNKIINTIEQCHLQNNVHFFDHYMFKYGLDLDNYSEDIFKKIAFTKIDKVHVKSLENIGIEGRVNYYDQTGAIEDMIFHLFSMVIKFYKKFNKNLCIDRLILIKLMKSQYDGYREEVGNPHSNTETYFMMNLLDKENEIELVLESGKKQPKKETSMQVFVDNNEILYISVGPEVFIEYFSNSKKLYLPESASTHDEHVNMFESLLKKDYSNFWQFNDIKKVWKFVEGL